MRGYFKMKIIKLKVLEREWLKLWLNDDIIPELEQFNQHEDITKMKLKIAYDILEKLK